MTDNFAKIRGYMADAGLPYEKDKIGDKFFDIQLIRRGKDHKDLAAANYVFKAYYIDAIELYDRHADEMRRCCDMFGLRAYVSVNAKSKKEAHNKTLLKYAETLNIGEYRKPWKNFASVCGTLGGQDESRWIVDIDSDDLDTSTFADYLNTVENAIGRCECKYERRIIDRIPTRAGAHLVTHPFNIKKFSFLMGESKYAMPEIKKNHITLLYENL